MEIEAKYSVPDRATFERLLGLRVLGDYALRDSGLEQLTDHYLDTPGRSVERGGYALRLRQAAEQDEWLATLKSLGGAEGALHRREELEVGVPAMALPAAWPESPARELALRLAAGEPLAELFDLEQTRHRRAVLAGERTAAELNLDAVLLSTAAGDEVTYELEIELRPDGTADDLESVASALQVYGLAPQPRSKFARALELLDHGAQPAPPPGGKSAGIQPDDPMAEAGRKVLRFHFERMVAQEDDVRAGRDIRSVHQMRVAARRQRAALRLFGHYYQPKTLRRLRAGLQQVARRLGAVRDLDVQLEAVREYAAKLAPEAVAGLSPLLDAWTADRDEARAALLAHLDSDAYLKFKRKYARFIGTPGAGVAHPHGPAPLLRYVIPGRLWDHYAHVRAYENIVPGAPMETLHALRIEGKRLRYALEFVEEAVDPTVKLLIDTVVALQEHLGALHDLDVCVAQLQAFEAGLGKRATGPTRRALRAYQADRRTRLSASRRTLGPIWREVVSPRFRKRLARIATKL
jgi:inorganic triphosphatase YgiF